MLFYIRKAFVRSIKTDTNQSAAHTKHILTPQKINKFHISLYTAEKDTTLKLRMTFFFFKQGNLLGLRLLCDVSDGCSFLPDDGSYELRGDQHPQRNVRLGLLPRGGTGGPLPRGAPLPESASALGMLLRRLLGCHFIGDICDFQGVVFKLKPVQFFYCSVCLQRGGERKGKKRNRTVTRGTL